MHEIVDNNTDGGESGTPGRPTRYNNNLEKIHEIVDLIASEDYSEGWEKRVLSTTDLAARPDLNLGGSAINKNGFPAYWQNNYEGCEWDRGRGLVIDLETYLMERAWIDYNKSRENDAGT